VSVLVVALNSIFSDPLDELESRVTSNSSLGALPVSSASLWASGGKDDLGNDDDLNVYVLPSFLEPSPSPVFKHSEYQPLGGIQQQPAPVLVSNSFPAQSVSMNQYLWNPNTAISPASAVFAGGYPVVPSSSTPGGKPAVQQAIKSPSPPAVSQYAAFSNHYPVPPQSQTTSKMDPFHPSQASFPSSLTRSSLPTGAPSSAGFGAPGANFGAPGFGVQASVGFGAPPASTGYAASSSGFGGPNSTGFGPAPSLLSSASKPFSQADSFSPGQYYTPVVPRLPVPVAPISAMQRPVANVPSMPTAMAPSSLSSTSKEFSYDKAPNKPNAPPQMVFIHAKLGFCFKIHF
jgi:hypothetical protein